MTTRTAVLTVMLLAALPAAGAAGQANPSPSRPVEAAPPATVDGADRGRDARAAAPDLALGVGFVASAFASYALSRQLGLVQRHAPNA